MLRSIWGLLLLLLSSEVAWAEEQGSSPEPLESLPQESFVAPEMSQTGEATTSEASSWDGSSLNAMSLEELLNVTVTSTKNVLTTEQAPSVVDVLPYNVIRERGYRTVGEAIQHLAGVYVIDDHVYRHVGVRGIFGNPEAPSETIKLMINGQSVSFRSTGTNFLGNDLIPIEAVARIEVLRSPSSALYGANAFLGVINIITFRGLEAEAARHPKNSVGLDGYLLQNATGATFNGTVAALSSGQYGPFTYMLAANFQRADRSGLLIPGLNDMIREAEHARDPSENASPTKYPSPGWDEASRHYAYRNAQSQNDIETTASVYGIATLEAFKDVDIQLDGHLQYSHRSAEFQHYTYLTHGSQLTYLNGFGRLKASYNSGATEGLSATGSFAVSAGAPTAAERIVDRRNDIFDLRRAIGYLAFDGQLEATYGFSFPLSLSVGTDLSYDREDLQNVIQIDKKTGDESVRGGLGTLDFINMGAYLQAISEPIERLTLTVGARLDYNSQVPCRADSWDCLGSREDVMVQNVGLAGEDVRLTNRGLMKLSARAAAVYELPFYGMYTKAIYNSSFKPPTPFQLYHTKLTLSGSSIDDPSLKPQTADTIELMVGSKPREGIDLSLTGFYTDARDVVLLFKNEDQIEGRNANIRVAGLEGKLSYQFQSTPLLVYCNATAIVLNQTRPQRKAGETDFAWQFSPFRANYRSDRFPDLMANIGGTLGPVFQYLVVNAEMRVVGSRRASSVNAALFDRFDLGHSYELSGYVAADLTVSTVGLHLFEWLGEKETILSLSARNLPGNYTEAGFGGIDVPSLGASLFFRLAQEL